ncbi:MAG: CoA transferase [Pseudomonadota bacterium]
MTVEHCLTGLKVVDFTRALAGPSCTRMLAEMGAEVVKIETPPDGDMVRRLSCFTHDRSHYLVQWNLNKKSVCLDLRTDEGLNIVRELITQADVVVENFRPGVMADMGLGYDDLCKLKPDIVLCSISAFGQTGPMATNPGYDYIAQAYAGITSMIGDPDEAPCIPLVGLGDASTGVHGALAITSAMLYHGRSGKGQHLDVNLLDVYFSYHEVNVHQFAGSGGTIKPTRGGQHMSYISPAGIYKATNGYIMILAFMQHWKDLCTAMERPDLLTHDIFGDDTSRTEHRFELVPIIEQWLQSFPDVDSAMQVLNEHHVPSAPVLTVAETLDNEHLKARGSVQTVTDPIAGLVTFPRMPIRFSEFTDEPNYVAPKLGQHNAEVLHSWLGKSSEEINTLSNSGVLLSKDT